EGNGPVGWLNLPFKDSILPMMKGAMGHGFEIFRSEVEETEKFYRRIDTEDEYDKVKNFVDEYNQVVFLRDLLDISLALSINLDDEDNRTEIGELGYEAKYQHNGDAERRLNEICQNWVNKFPYFKNADYICAMPCSNRAHKSLPRRIVDALAGEFENISESVYWQSKARSLKDVDNIEDKLPILESSNLTIDRKLDGKAVFLFDDLYMSGLSMQYVAMKLKEAGAKWVFGLCLMKSRNNTTR